MSTLRLGTLNINGARESGKRTMLYELIRQKKYDVMMVQETHSDVKNEREWKMEWDGEVILSHKNSSSGGVAVLFQKHIKPISYEVEHIVEGQLLKVRVKFEKFVLVFVNIYAPVHGPERVYFIQKLSDALSSFEQEEYMFMGGDFNCTENHKVDRNHKEPHMASQNEILKLVAEHDLYDIWRILHKNERQYTWAQARENLISLARLDRFYCFRHHFNVIKKCMILPVSFSDHCLVECNIYIANIKPKSAYWHFNILLLQDNAFIETFIYFWKQFGLKKHEFKSLKQWWDYGKVEIQQLCRQYTLNVSREISRSMRNLHCKPER